MDSEKVFLVKQLANRLESASSGERIDALQELQSLARSHPDIVGEHSLQRVLNFLKEQGSAEEYQESLDVLYRLVKSKDKIAAKANTTIVLSDLSNTELLLDLLEHEDLTVGVMTSQILTEIHANDGPDLEAAIQQCPDGNSTTLQCSLLLQYYY